MVLRLFLGSHGTLVAVSAPLLMPLRDSDIPMNVPFTFSNKQPLTSRKASLKRSPSSSENPEGSTGSTPFPSSAQVSLVSPSLPFALYFSRHIICSHRGIGSSCVCIRPHRRLPLANLTCPPRHCSCTHQQISKEPLGITLDVVAGGLSSPLLSKGTCAWGGHGDLTGTNRQRACTRHRLAHLQKSEVGPSNRHGCHHHCTSTRMHQKENDSVRV